MATRRKFEIPEDEFVIAAKEKEEIIEEPIKAKERPVKAEAKSPGFILPEPKKKRMARKNDITRFNMIFDIEMATYIREESKAQGLTITEFVGEIIREYAAQPGHKNY